MGISFFRSFFQSSMIKKADNFLNFIVRMRLVEVSFAQANAIIRKTDCRKLGKNRCFFRRHHSGIHMTREK